MRFTTSFISNSFIKLSIIADERERENIAKNYGKFAMIVIFDMKMCHTYI